MARNMTRSLAETAALFVDGANVFEVGLGCRVFFVCCFVFPLACPSIALRSKHREGVHRNGAQMGPWGQNQDWGDAIIS